MTDETLTPAGWPRPIIGGWPIPWVSPAENLASMNGDRVKQCADGTLCAVCGCRNDPDAPAFICVKSKEPPKTMADVGVRAMDDGIMHRRCLLLAVARCPVLKRLRADGELQIVKVRKPWPADVVFGEDKIFATFDGADCEIVDLAEI